MKNRAFPLLLPLLAALSAGLLPAARSSLVAHQASAVVSIAASRLISRASASDSPVTIDRLESEINARAMRVEEFQFIRAEAEKLGVRVWLFGGTAAGYGHYVSWDLKRESGDARFQKDRFDYDYTNIYRSNQDLDVVIDGKPEQAQALQHALEQRYPHLQGSKTAWEVRILKSQMGVKEALLDNPDFLNQHTDSNSTGMIELTKPAPGERAVRDLRDWKSPRPFFLKDLQEGRLHYYFSDLHGKTARAAQGMNPPILSVIRYLTKAFQYELELRPEDLAIVRKIVQDFDPSSIRKGDYVGSWIEKNGKKLIQNAVNVDYASRKLEELGLDSKLIAIRNDAGKEDTLAWWLSKEPLRDRPLGTTGKTARELGITTVAHETNKYPAYESITRAHTGDPNVLISRNGRIGEAAVHGDGFYTQIGTEGARGTGLTIRFNVDQNAREGVDFTKHGSYVVFQNKRAIRVIPESLNWGVLQYFEFLARSEDMKHSDLGIFEKLRRRVGSRLKSVPAEDLPRIREIVLAKTAKQHPNPSILSNWLRIPQSVDDTEVLDRVVAVRGTAAIDEMLREPHWNQDRAGDTSALESLIDRLLAHGADKDSKQSASIEKILKESLAKGREPETDARLIKRIILARPDLRPALREKVLRADWASAHPELFRLAYPATLRHEQLELAHVLRLPGWDAHPELFRGLLASLPKPGARSMIFRDSAEAGKTADPLLALAHALAKPSEKASNWIKHPELIREVVRAGISPELMARILGSSAKPLPEEDAMRGAAARALFEEISGIPDPGERQSAMSAFVRDFLATFHRPVAPELVGKTLAQGVSVELFLDSALEKDGWKTRPEITNPVLRAVLATPAGEERGRLVLSAGRIVAGHGYNAGKERAQADPELIVKLIRDPQMDPGTLRVMFVRKEFSSDPRFVQAALDWIHSNTGAADLPELTRTLLTQAMRSPAIASDGTLVGQLVRLPGIRSEEFQEATKHLHGPGADPYAHILAQVRDSERWTEVARGILNRNTLADPRITAPILERIRAGLAVQDPAIRKSALEVGIAMAELLKGLKSFNRDPGIPSDLLALGNAEIAQVVGKSLLTEAWDDDARARLAWLRYPSDDARFLEVANHLLRRDSAWIQEPALLEALYERVTRIQDPHSRRHYLNSLARVTVSRPTSRSTDAMLMRMLANPEIESRSYKHELATSGPDAFRDPEIIDAFFKRIEADLASIVPDGAHEARHGISETIQWLAGSVLPGPALKSHPEFAERLFALETPPSNAITLLRQSDATFQSAWLRKLTDQVLASQAAPADKAKQVERFAQYVGDKLWNAHPEGLRRLIEGGFAREVSSVIYSNYHILQGPEILRLWISDAVAQGWGAGYWQLIAKDLVQRPAVTVADRALLVDFVTKVPGGLSYLLNGGGSKGLELFKLPEVALAGVNSLKTFSVGGETAMQLAHAISQNPPPAQRDLLARIITEASDPLPAISRLAKNGEIRKEPFLLDALIARARQAKPHTETQAKLLAAVADSLPYDSWKESRGVFERAREAGVPIETLGERLLAANPAPDASLLRTWVRWARRSAQPVRELRLARDALIREEWVKALPEETLALLKLLPEDAGNEFLLRKVPAESRARLTALARQEAQPQPWMREYLGLSPIAGRTVGASTAAGCGGRFGRLFRSLRQ